METKTIKDLFNEIKIEDDFYAVLTEYVARGNTTVQQNRIMESLELDDKWILTIEESLLSVERIVKDPHKSIIDFYNLVNTERAKRTDSKTVRFLSQHTNFIRKIEDDGRINPSKVLSKEMDEDVLIYENRFVFTLINNLLYFVTGRYNAIKKNIETHDTTNLKVNSKFKLRKGEVEFDMSVRVRNETNNKVVLQRNKALLDKLDIIRKRINVITGSYFYRLLSKAKPVVAPIMKTNIINMHKDYKNCYRLWLFISSYNTVGYSVDVTSKVLPVDTEYYEDLTMLIAMSLKTMFNNNAVRRPHYKKTPFAHNVKRKYKEIRKIDYDQYSRSVAYFDDRDGINQYYYDKLKEMIMQKEELKSNEIQSLVTVKATFQTFFRSLTNLTNELYHDVMGITKAQMAEETKLTTLQKKFYAYEKQEGMLKKYHLLSQLKLRDLQTTLMRENTQKIKLEKLKFDYEFAFQKKNGKKAKKPRKPRTSQYFAEVDEQKIAALYAAAKKDEAERMEKELARQEAIKKKEAERLERLAKAREEQKKIREIAKQILLKQQEEEEKAEAESGVSPESEENSDIEVLYENISASLSGDNSANSDGNNSAEE